MLQYVPPLPVTVMLWEKDFSKQSQFPLLICKNARIWYCFALIAKVLFFFFSRSSLIDTRQLKAIKWVLLRHMGAARGQLHQYDGVLRRDECPPPHSPTCGLSNHSVLRERLGSISVEHFLLYVWFKWVQTKLKNVRQAAHAKKLSVQQSTVMVLRSAWLTD